MKDAQSVFCFTTILAINFNNDIIIIITTELDMNHKEKIGTLELLNALSFPLTYIASYLALVSLLTYTLVDFLLFGDATLPIIHTLLCIFAFALTIFGLTLITIELTINELGTLPNTHKKLKSNKIKYFLSYAYIVAILYLFWFFVATSSINFIPVAVVAVIFHLRYFLTALSDNPDEE